MTEADQDSITALDYIENQLQLEQDARENMPYDPNHCTYFSDPPRQQVFACLTCRDKKGQDNGICYSCSIQCHSNHDLVELFTRRQFTCDCGTDRMASFGGCNLRKNFDSLDDAGSGNVYNHNFAGKFCDCNSTYNADTEQSVMFQCFLGVACGEDWFHEECVLGVPRSKQEKDVKSEESDGLSGEHTRPTGVNLFDELEPASSDNVKPPEDIKREQDAEEEEEDEEQEDDTLEGLPNQSDFDAFICWRCVAMRRTVLEKLASMEEIAHSPVYRQTQASISDSNFNTSDTPEHLGKRKGEVEEQAAKRAKVADTSAPFSLFLKDGFRDHLIKSEDPAIKNFLLEFPFFAEEEPVYEPPQDDDATSSLLDAGARALNSLPRDQALDGMKAYSMIRERLKLFLQPFADQHRVVTANDVTSFFEDVKGEHS